MNAPARPAVAQTARSSSTAIDRHTGILDTLLLSNASILQIGVGRGVGFARLMTAAGVRHITAVDPGNIDAENVGQSDYGWSSVGLPKPDALERSLLEIEPRVVVTKYHCRADAIEDLPEVMGAHALLKIGIDDMRPQFALADLAQEAKVDAIIAGTQGDNTQFFIAGAFAGGPTLRELLPEIWKSLDDGYKPPAFFASSLVNATTLNVVAARIALGILHFRAGSQLPISDVGRAFIERPLVIGLNGVHEASGFLVPMRLVGERH